MGSRWRSRAKGRLSHLGSTDARVSGGNPRRTERQASEIAQIGPAGERLVRYACILNDLKYANGRSGLGAVMGSKNLKAIAVRGHNRLELKDPEKIKEIGKWFNENWQKHPGALSRSRLGTADALLASNADGILPTRNFVKGTFDHAEDISGDRMKDTILVGTEGCYACSIRCKRVVKAKPPYETNPAYGGPEYETLAALAPYARSATSAPYHTPINSVTHTD